LRFIKQLSIAYLVYPGATHSRFEHSIGTMHLSGLIAKRLNLNVERARICGLLHDIGHVAFSHTGESVLNELGIKKNHEELGKELLDEVLKESPYTRKEIEKCKEMKVVSFSLGSDRLDYLRRDAYYCGVSFGYVDYEQILANMEMHKNKIVVKEGGLSSTEMLFIARFLMFFTVYLHRTVRIANEMLKEALKECLKKQVITLEDLIWKGDSFCLHKMASYNKMAKALIQRKLFKEIDKTHRSNIKYYLKIKPSKVKKKEDKILIKTRDGKLKEINKVSPLIANLDKSIKKRSKVIYAYPNFDLNSI
jgi:hypothetical protein